MTAGASEGQSDHLDQSWRRLLWEVPAAATAWLVLLLALGLIVAGRRPQAQQEVVRLDARLVDVPPAAGGLQAGGGTGPPAAAAPAAGPPAPAAEAQHDDVKSKIEARPPPASAVAPASKRVKQAAPPADVKRHAVTTRPDSRQDATGTAASNGAAPSGTAGGDGAMTGPSGSGGGDAGLGTSSVGARAIYAPAPEIPEDLREDVFEAEALARFRVDDDGHATVELVKGTSNPRLNRILLDALQAWRFAPAIDRGIKVSSEFDVRIPIAVR
jgi:protein TonB